LRDRDISRICAVEDFGDHQGAIPASLCGIRPDAHHPTKFDEEAIRVDFWSRNSFTKAIINRWYVQFSTILATTTPSTLSYAIRMNAARYTPAPVRRFNGGQYEFNARPPCRFPHRSSIGRIRTSHRRIEDYANWGALAQQRRCKYGTVALALCVRSDKMNNYYSLIARGYE
jgi:hypothetical protein